MKRRSIRNSLQKRSLCLQSALSLLFFLIFSAPHRVHHFFDQPGASPATEPATASVQDHVEDDHENHPSLPPPGSRQNDCVVLTATQNAHALAAAPFELTIFATIHDPTRKSFIPFVASFNPSPRSQRAPPLI